VPLVVETMPTAGNVAITEASVTKTGLDATPLCGYATPEVRLAMRAAVGVAMTGSSASLLE
jgi:hypothetical protein